MFMTSIELLPLRELNAECAPLPLDSLTSEAAESLARQLKALGDPTRLKLISMVSAHPSAEACVCDLQEPLGLSQPTVSHHLKSLVDAGFLHREKRGTWAYYSLVPGALERVASLVTSI